MKKLYPSVSLSLTVKESLITFQPILPINIKYNTLV